MSKTEPDFDEALRALAAEARRQTPAPSPAELEAYCAGALSIDEEEALRDRIALHPEAARTVRDLSAFPDLALDPDTGLDDRDIVPSWDSVRARIDAEAAQGERPRAATSGRRRIELLAAILVAAVLGLGLWSVSLRTTVEGLQMPHVGPPQTPPNAVGGRTPRAAVDPRPVDFDDGSAVLILETDLEGGFPRYEVAIRSGDRTGASHWRYQARPDDRGLIALTLPRGFLPVGAYWIEVAGVDGDTRVAVSGYAIEIAEK